MSTSTEKPDQQKQQQQQQQQQATTSTELKIDSSTIREATKEVNDFWRTKVKFYFNEILDFDSDGHVSSKDVDAFKDMYKYIKNLQQDSPELENFSRFLNLWIDNILTLTNAKHTEEASKKSTPPTFTDEKDTSTPRASTTTISLGDFMVYCETIRRDLIGRHTWPQSLHYMSDYIDALFNILDTDNDGYISREDFLSNYASAEDYTSRQESWEILSSREPAHKLDKKRFDQLCIEFLVSTTPSDPGNWIFGTFAH